MGNLSKSNAKLHEAEIAAQLTQIKFKSFFSSLYIFSTAYGSRCY